jgi:hypothetical protein
MRVKKILRKKLMKNGVKDLLKMTKIEAVLEYKNNHFLDIYVHLDV